VAIDDVLPFNAARRDVTGNRKLLGLQDTSDVISMAPFTFAMWRQLIPLSPLYGERMRKVRKTYPIFRHLAYNFVDENRHKISSFNIYIPQFLGRTPQIFNMHLQIWFTFQHVVKFGWVLFADLRVRNMAIKYNAEFTDGE